MDSEMKKIDEDVGNLPYISRTILVAQKLHQQDPKTYPVPPEENLICRRCPRALWRLELNTKPGELKNFCETSHEIVWTSDLPNNMPLCDGPIKEEMADEARREQSKGQNK